MTDDRCWTTRPWFDGPSGAVCACQPWSLQTHSRISYDVFTILVTSETSMLIDPRIHGTFFFFFFLVCEYSSSLTIHSTKSGKVCITSHSLFCHFESRVSIQIIESLKITMRLTIGYCPFFNHETKHPRRPLMFSQAIKTSPNFVLVFKKESNAERGGNVFAFLRKGYYNYKNLRVSEFHRMEQKVPREIYSIESWFWEKSRTQEKQGKEESLTHLPLL